MVKDFRIGFFITLFVHLFVYLSYYSLPHAMHDPNDTKNVNLQQKFVRVMIWKILMENENHTSVILIFTYG